MKLTGLAGWVKIQIIKINILLAWITKIELHIVTEYTSFSPIC